MYKELKNFLIGLLVLIIYLLSGFIASIVLMILKIDVYNMSRFGKIVYNLLFEFILLGIIIFIYRRTLIDNFKKIKNCKFFSYIRYWFISLGLMLISSIVIDTFTHISTTSNQKIIEDTFSKAPIYTIILTIICAPILEELVFRLSFRKMFKTNILFFRIIIYYSI